MQSHDRERGRPTCRTPTRRRSHDLARRDEKLTPSTTVSGPFGSVERDLEVLDREHILFGRDGHNLGSPGRIVTVVSPRRCLRPVSQVRARFRAASAAFAPCVAAGASAADVPCPRASLIESPSRLNARIDERDGDAGDDDQQGFGEDVGEAVPQHPAPAGVRWRHTEAENCEPGLGEDGAADRDGHRDDERGGDAGKDPLPQHRARRCADRARRLDVGLLFHREGLRADRGGRGPG